MLKYCREIVAQAKAQLLPLFKPGVPISTLKTSTLRVLDKMHALLQSQGADPVQLENSDLRRTQKDLTELNAELMSELTDFAQMNEELVHILSRLQREKAAGVRRLVHMKQSYQKLKEQAVAWKPDEVPLTEETEMVCQTLESQPDEDTELHRLQQLFKQWQAKDTEVSTLKSALHNATDLISRLQAENQQLLAIKQGKTQAQILTLLVQSEANLSSRNEETDGQKQVVYWTSAVPDKVTNVVAGDNEEHKLLWLRREVTHLQQKNEALQTQNTQLAETVTQLKAEQMKSSEEQLAKQLAATQSRLEERNALQTQVQSLQQTLSQLTRENQGLAQIVQEYQVLSTENSSSQQQINALETEKSALEERVKELEQDNYALKITLEEAEEFHSATAMSYLAQIEGLRMEINTKSVLYKDQTVTNIRKIQELKQELGRMKREAAG